MTHPPDVILIVLDTLRADRLSCYGHPEPTTPNLDAFAAESVLFEHAISPAQWTIPAHGSLFTGEFPSAHGTTQIYDKHDPACPTLAEHLAARGYRTAGFCNNPLLGVVENDLDRGFQEFYNYGGVLPNRPNTAVGAGLPGAKSAPPSPPSPPRRLLTWLRKQLTRLNGPVQAIFTRDHVMLNLVLQPWLVALWERNINFKGNTRQSVDDVLGTLKHHHARPDRDPIFVYLNLMETHLPYRTPVSFSRRFAPTYHHDRKARAWLRAFNYRTYDWIAPITEPFSDAQHRVLNEMYNAEVAYEDHLLQPLLTYLDRPDIRDDTMVIIMSDHGEGLDHHHFVGHSLVVYEDLLRVPLIVRYPPHYPAGTRVADPVSTRRIYHTILDAAGVSGSTSRSGRSPTEPAVDAPEPAPEPSSQNRSGRSPRRDVDAPVPATEGLSLRHALDAHPIPDPVWAEAYPPITLLKLIESRNPEAVNPFACRSVRRALYDGTAKLITLDDAPAELYDLAADPAERTNTLPADPTRAATLDAQLSALVAAAQSRHPQHTAARAETHPEQDQALSERLRRLGYIE